MGVYSISLTNTSIRRRRSRKLLGGVQSGVSERFNVEGSIHKLSSSDNERLEVCLQESSTLGEIKE